MHLQRSFFFEISKILRRVVSGFVLALVFFGLFPATETRAETEALPKKRGALSLQQRLTIIQYNSIEFKGTLTKETLEYLVMQVQVPIRFDLDKTAAQHRVSLTLTRVNTLDCMKALCREAGWTMTLGATVVEIRKLSPPKD